ncbi:hypothetical protein FOL47_000917 [Perkinsus chesapeaki]|uniref:PH domain-containing protein n=1 Tax=Perkinsus chesapeaki TaxID=330153 RepID=A0A7J6N0V3_PERCH|nr:hypothetical protein FOL47_000917 [Perkinsus chesapeaki]
MFRSTSWLSNSTATASENSYKAPSCCGGGRTPSEIMARKSRTVSWASDLDTVIKCPSGDPPLFEGLLWKESLHLKRWSLRWCVIPADKAAILCYVRKGDRNPSEILELNRNTRLSAYSDADSWAVEIGNRALCYDSQCNTPGGCHRVSTFMHAVGAAIGCDDGDSFNVGMGLDYPIARSTSKMPKKPSLVHRCDHHHQCYFY